MCTRCLSESGGYSKRGRDCVGTPQNGWGLLAPDRKNRVGTTCGCGKIFAPPDRISTGALNSTLTQNNRPARENSDGSFVKGEYEIVNFR